jgi:drug/metabolite transporter (DMT)-like permease
LTDGGGRIGVLLAATGAISYGVTVVIGRDLAEAGIGSSTALAGRFAVAGVILLVVVRVRGVPLATSRRGALQGLALGAWYSMQSAFFFSALERGTAAAVALVFYVYPAIVTVVEVLRGRERLHRSTLVALALSSAGTAIVVVGGGTVSISVAGLLFALAAAAAFAGYLLGGREVARAADPMAVACLVSISAAVLSFARGAVTAELVDPSRRVLELGGYGLATALAFSLTFAAMRRIGATRVAVVMTLEAASAVVMAAIFLGESVNAAQAVGGVAVLGAAAVIARSHPQDVATATASAPAAGT